MPATTTLLGLVTPTQGTLSGTWGDTVNYGISDYVDISVAGTLTLTNDGAVTLANTTGSSSGNSITSSLTGAGTVTAQFAIVKVTGTLTVAKVVTGPSYSKTYTVVNSATGGIVTFKASGQTGVSIAVGESAFVYFNGTDYVKVSGTVAVASFQTSLGGLTPSTATTGVVTLAGTLNTTSGGTGLTSFTAGDVPYYASGSVLSKLAIGTAGQFLTSTGTAPQWSTLSGVAVTTFSAGTTGFTPSSATSGAVTLAGTLATTNGGTGLTSFTSGGVVYASSTSALATGSALSFDGSRLGVGTSSPSTYGKLAVVGGNGTGSTIIASYGGTSAGDYGLLVLGTGTTAKASMNVDSANNNVRFDTRGNTGDFYWASGASYTETMRLTSTGLGIGTSSPNKQLSIAASVPTAQFQSTNTAIASGNSFGNLTWYSSDASASSTGVLAQIDAVANRNFDGDQSATGMDMRFLTAPLSSANSPIERMRIDYAGNVGIGTSSPSVLLHVNSASQDGGKILIQSGTLSNNNRATLFMSAINVNGQTGNVSIECNHPNNQQSDMVFRTGATDATSFGTERMRLDTSGNLGLGVTPSAWATVLPVLQVSNASFTGYNNQAILSSNWYYNAGNKYIASTFATQYTQNSGQHIWYNAPSGTAGNAITFTQAMTLDASGRLGVGTTTPLSGTRITAVGGGVHAQAIAATGSADSFGDGGGLMLEYLGGVGSIRAYSDTSGNGSTTINFLTAGTERFRIGPSGQLGIGGATYGTSGQVLTSGGSAAAPTWSTPSGGGSINVQTFTSSGTWTKPSLAAGSRVMIQVWGAGGSGAKSTTRAGGGGGGGYMEKWVTLSSLGSTETITIGAGGVVQSTAGTNGNVGGNTTVGSIATAYGGGGGRANATSGTGGGGGGEFSAGSLDFGAFGGGGTTDYSNSYQRSRAASQSQAANSFAGQRTADAFTVYGGGGGSTYYDDGCSSWQVGGGRSVWGGAGGGSAGTSQIRGGAGTSINGGNGGAAGSTGTAGTAPAGGGGASWSGDSGAGAAGQVIITVFPA